MVAILVSVVEQLGEGCGHIDSTWECWEKVEVCVSIREYFSK